MVVPRQSYNFSFNIMTLTVPIFFWLSFITIGVQCQSLKGANVVVTTVLETPYVMLRESSHNLTGNDRFEGYIVDLMDTIAKKAGFNYQLVVNSDGMYGSLLRSGKWSGMIGELIDGRAHIAAGGMTITAEREKVVDFTVPFMSLGITVLYKGETHERSAFDDALNLFFPFQYYTTDAFLLLTLIFGIILLVLRRKYKTIVFRILLGIWLLFLFIFAALYIAQLTSVYVAFVGVKMQTVPFISIQELASQSQVSYGCVKGGATEGFFRNSESSIYRKMYSRMLSEPQSFVTSTMEGIERVLNSDFAFIAESTAIEYAVERHCSLRQIGGLIDSKGFGLAVQKQGTALRTELSHAILVLQEQGVLQQLKEKWWREKNGAVCGN